MTATITRLFDSYTAASEAVSDLKIAGIVDNDISLVSNNTDGWFKDGKVDRDGDGTDDRAESAGKGAGIGAGVGGAAGLLAGLGLMAIPGLGPVVAAGWLAATALGAAAGATAGGIIGALTQAGVSEDDAHVYAEGIRRGGTLVTVRVPDSERSKVEAILDRSAVNTSTRADAYRKTGWKSFDPASKPYTLDQVQEERRRYRRV